MVARLARGEAGAGISLDFFAREAAGSGAQIAVRYPADTLYTPAQVGILRNAGNARAAGCFVDFLLSERGQRLIAAPGADRLPMRPAVYRQLAPALPDPFRRAQPAQVHDTPAGLRRQPLVTLLFDAAIASHHEQLAIVWRAMADAKRSGRVDEATLALARRIATRLPLSEQEADRLALRSDDPRRRALREQWRGLFARNYRAAAATIAGGACA
jgi:ABC-type Fe3+ transport system substrate-binding protein